MGPAKATDCMANRWRPGTRDMQNGMTASSGSLHSGPATVKCPTRIITYAWGKRYVDTLLTLTLPALLAPGNLPYVASQVPCELVILTQRRFFSKFNRHPAIARVRSICPVRFVKLDDLIVSKDKYGMTLTYALHRAFSDLGPAMTEHWQIFLNADFILANGSLRTLIGHLSRGQRIVAAPSYCSIASDVIPELYGHLDASTSTLSISNRELAALVLRHRHTVIRGKTVNQTSFHMRYIDQFYWFVDEATLTGYQMPVSIVGLRPERYLPEPNTYWDFGLIWEYCPQAEVCVIGDSDEFMMLELRDDNVAQDQIVLGPPNKKEIAERMITWVTPYQRYFLKFPLTLHCRDLPSNIDDARTKLQSFVDDVLSHAPPFPSHLKHSQWDYHWAGFHDARRTSRRIQSSIAGILKRAVKPAVWFASRTYRAILRGEKKAKALALAKHIARTVAAPVLRRFFGLEVVKSTTLSDMYTEAKEAARLKRKNTELERTDDHQTIPVQDKLRSEMSTLEPDFLALYKQCSQYTRTSWETLYALYKSIQYIVANRIPGDMLESGVSGGGSMKLVAHLLLSLGDSDRTLFLYDPIEVVTEPESDLRLELSRNSAIGDQPEIERRDVKSRTVPVEGIREIIAASGYPIEKVKVISNAIENTIPATISQRFALLRLQTNWYPSTKREMELLYPRLSPRGILILDSYGHYQGVCRGVDEYMSRLKEKPLLQRIDYACRLAVKPIH